MEDFQEKKMFVYDKLATTDSFNEFVDKLPSDFDGFVFYSIRKDSIGQSSSNPTWGDFYKYSDNKLRYKGVCIFKHFDYDSPYAPYAEKLYSLLK